MSPLPVPSLDSVIAEKLLSMTTTLQPGTLVTYRAAVNRFLRFIHTCYPEVNRLSQLRRNPHILGWLRSLCEQGPTLANETRGNYVIALRRVFQDLAAERRHHLRDGLLIREDIPPADQHLPRPLSPEDDELLQNQLRQTDDLESNALLLMRATGIRVGECLRLTADCLRHLGEDQWALHVPLGKLHTERWVPVDDNVRSLVDRILALRHQNSAPTVPVESSEWLLPRRRNLRSSYHRIRQALNVAAQRARCSSPVLPHQLRHTFATWMLRAGVSLPAVKLLLGHKCLTMTLRYVQVSQNDLQREFHTARLKLATPHPPLSLAATEPNPSTGLPAVSLSLATTQHLLEMYRRQLPDGAIRRKLDRLANRLSKISAELALLSAPEQ
jgi:site-specific recombinase XerD